MSVLARRLPLLLSAAFVLLGVAWLAEPSAAGPDEPSHYLRALSIGRGDLFGEQTTTAGMTPENAKQAEHLRRTTRSVEVPAGLAVPASWSCIAIEHTGSGACLGDPAPNARTVRQATQEGANLPFLYVPAGLAMRLAKDATGAMDLARVASGVVSFSLIVLAIFLLWDGSTLSLLGVPLAVSPAVVFIGTVINPSGAEIGASIALLAFLLRLSRPSQPPAWGWWAGITAAVVLSLARPLGAIWVVFLVTIGITFGGPRTILRALRTAPVAARFCVALVPVAMLLGLGWQVVTVPPLRHSVAEYASLVAPSLVAVPGAFGEAMGVFGWVDTFMPKPAYAVWGLSLVTLVSTALLRGRHRERRTLDLLIVACFAATVAISALVMLPVGWGVQGRHVLPALMALPLVSGEILFRNREQLGRRNVAAIGAVVAIPAAAVQFLGWYSNAHRYAVGAAGSWTFFSQNEWRPISGWLPWAMIAAAATALLILCAIVPLRTAATEAV